MPTPSFATSTPRSRYVGVLHASFVVCGGSMGSWLLCLPVVVALREGTRNALTLVVPSWLDLYLACVVVWKRFCSGGPPLLLSYLLHSVQTTTVGLGPTTVSLSDSRCLSLSLSPRPSCCHFWGCVHAASGQPPSVSAHGFLRRRGLEIPREVS